MPINSSGPDWVTVIPRNIKGKRSKCDDLLFFLLSVLSLCSFTEDIKPPFNLPWLLLGIVCVLTKLPGDSDPLVQDIIKSKRIKFRR